MLLDKNLELLLMQAEVISFDVYDTLICRGCGLPQDVFDIIEENTGIKFRKKRMLAEKIARWKKHGTEITIDEIYDNLCIKKSEKARVKAMEIEIEKKIALPNKIIIEIYKYCLAKRKKIIITSDMYLNREVIVDILNSCGINTYDKLYLSSEIGLKKSTGALFEYILRELQINPEKLLHIGDNSVSDLKMPNSKGIITWDSKPKFKARELYQKRKFDSSIVRGFLRNNYAENVYYQIGKEVLGPLLYGFVNWLHEYIIKEKPDKVFFLSRDGRIMKKAYEALFGRHEHIKYVYASRRALIVPILWKNCSLEKIQSIIHFHDRMLISEFFERVGLSINECKNIIEKYNYNIDTRINGENLCGDKNFIKFFSEIQELIYKNSLCEYEAAKKFWENILDGCKKVFIVDIGWNGNIQNALNELIDDETLCIMGFYLGVNPAAKYKFSMNGYIYDKDKNQNLHQTFEHFSGILETMFMTDQGSLETYQLNPPYIKTLPCEYEIPDGRIVNELAVIKYIQDGAVNFVKRFHNFLSKCRRIFTINDATANLLNLALSPSLEAATALGDIRFFNSGVIDYLARSNTGKISLEELKQTNWRIGYMKRYLRKNYSYYDIAKIIKLAKRIKKLFSRF